MKKFLFILTVLLTQVCLFAQNQEQTINTIPEGISVPVQILQKISSENDNPHATAVVSGNVYDHDGNLLIKGGERVAITVTTEDNHPLGAPGYITIFCHNTQSVTGQPIYLIGEYSVEGEWHRGRAIATGIGLGLTVMPVIGFLFFLIQGDNVEIPAGYILPDVSTTSFPVEYLSPKKTKKKKNNKKMNDL